MRYSRGGARRRGDLFELCGSAGGIGHELGRRGARALRARVRDMLGLARRSRIPTPTLLARASDLLRTLRRVSPSWAEEAAGLAAGAGLETAHVLMLNTPPPDLYRCAGAECTSFVRIGASANLLLKIRDQRNRVQQVVVQCGRGRFRIQMGRDIGNLGAAFALNAHGLALGCNTGSYLEPRDDDAGRFNDCLMLRYYAERARCVRDIPRLYERLADAGASGGAAADRGAIILAADPSGGLILETGWDVAHSSWINDGTQVASNHFLSAEACAWAACPPNRNTQLRRARMRACLAGVGDADLPAIFAMTRDRRNAPDALCNDDRQHFWMTNSAWLYVLPHGRPDDAVSYVCCGNTRQSVYLPLPLTCRENWSPWVSGDFYRASDRLYRARMSRPAVPGRRVRAMEDRSLARHMPPVAVWREALALLRGAGVK